MLTVTMIKIRTWRYASGHASTNESDHVCVGGLQSHPEDEPPFIVGPRRLKSCHEVVQHAQRDETEKESHGYSRLALSTIVSG
jgi:hypothetical protein